MVQVRKSDLGYSIVMIYVRSFFVFFVCFIVQHGAGWKSLGSIGKRIPHHRLVWLRITKGRFWNLSFTVFYGKYQAHASLPGVYTRASQWNFYTC